MCYPCLRTCATHVSGLHKAERKAYDTLVARNPKHKKIAVVARMRVLAIRLWHDGLEAQQAQAG